MDNEVQSQSTPVDLAKLTSIYIKIRDKRADIKRTFEEEDNDLKEQMEVLESQMLDVCKDMNADSIRTPHGTIIRSVSHGTGQTIGIQCMTSSLMKVHLAC